MRKLLSLPPNVVDSFHRITGLSTSEYFCTCDPADAKLGSGGGTAWLLHEANPAPGEKCILIHGGGWSRRLPAYAPSGKLLMPVPVYRWARGQRIDQTLLSLQVPLYEKIMHAAPEGLRTLVASGDVLLRATEPLQAIPDADVVCYGLWAAPEQIAHHGVFMMRRDRPEELDFMLQKPSVEEQSRLMPTHYSLIDIGLWLLSDRAVEALFAKSRSKTDSTRFNYYDLYGDFGCALGENPSRPDAELPKLKVCILPLPGGEFYHFGTGREMVQSATELQNLVKDQRLIIQRGVKQQSSVFTQNSIVANRFTREQEEIWIENCRLTDDWHFTRRNILTGIPQNAWKVTMREGLCLDVVPVGDESYALRPYGYDDAFRGQVSDPATTFLGLPMCDWLRDHQLTADDLGGAEKDILSAKLFPAGTSFDELEALFHWMTATAPEDTALRDAYLAAQRYSAEELSVRANLERLFAQRKKILSENLPPLAANWEKSVFYQTNLDDMAEKFAAAALPLPAELPETAPLTQRIHDAMFRSRVYAHSDSDASQLWADASFSLLREGLTQQAMLHRVTPRKSVLDDQIVWGRSAVRIDLAGGWTDTPPYCLYAGGNVVNVAINLNGQQPLQVYVKPCAEPVVICRSIDLGAMERIETFEELALYNKVGSPFSIPKAALSLCGFLPSFSGEPYPSLRAQLEAFGCGIEITLLAAIPAGSGLGTSSVLASTVLGTLSEFCQLGWDKNEVANRTLVLEQLLTTGGGWQDQYGGILPGVKLLQSQSGFTQNPLARYLPDTIFTAPEYRDCHLLYYTGITRTAKHILADIVRGMFLNSSQHLRLLDEMRDHALAMFEALQLSDLQRYGQLLRLTWEQNKRLDSGTNPPAVEALCQQIDDLCLGYKLPGAGGGGFMYMVAKDPAAACRIREMLTEHPLNAKARFVDLTVSQKGLEISRS